MKLPVENVSKQTWTRQQTGGSGCLRPSSMQGPAIQSANNKQFLRRVNDKVEHAIMRDEGNLLRLGRVIIIMCMLFWAVTDRMMV